MLFMAEYQAVRMTDRPRFGLQRSAGEKRRSRQRAEVATRLLGGVGGRARERVAREGKERGRTV